MLGNISGIAGKSYAETWFDDATEKHHDRTWHLVA